MKFNLNCVSGCAKSVPHISGGEVAGIVIGSLVAVVAFAGMGYFLYRRSKESNFGSSFYYKLPQ